MAAKLLHSLTDENPDLQKQIGCMTGIFQLFDRQHVLTGGRRVVGHAPKRLTYGNSHFHSFERESNNVHQRSASTEKYSHRNIQEKQRISTESSRASFSSSSRSSSFSSLDCNRPTQLEPASYDRILFPETPSRDPAMSLHNSSTQFSRQSLDIRDLVKDSMYREVHGLSIKARTNTDEAADPVIKYRDSPRPHSKISDNSIDTKQRRPADLKESVKALTKLQEAPWYQNEPKELLRSASYNAREGSSFSVPRDAPRFSYDGREINRGPPFDPRDISKSALKLKDIPRLSLDSRESSMRGANADYKSNVFSKSMQKDNNTVEFDGKVQTRPPSVVAKLMGLETLPDSVSSSNDANSVSRHRYADDDFVNNIPRSSAKTNRNSIQTSRSLWKEPGSPSWRNSDSSMKPMSRFPIEPAPWKQIDGTKSVHKPASRATRAQAKASPTYPSVYSEIEKRLKHLEFTQSGKDLRALKQILEAMQSKGFLETEKDVRGSNEQKHLSSNHEARSVNNNQKSLDSTNRRTGYARNYESPIVIMKPAKLVEKSGIPAASVVSLDSLNSCRGAKDYKASQQESALNSINTKNERTQKITQALLRLPQLAKDGSGKNSGSISPRMQHKKLELEKRSRPPTPPDSSKSRRQPNKQQSESNSPGGRRRLRNPNLQQNGDQPNEKSTRALIEEESAEFGFVPPEYSSPVSVLDKVVCKDDSPSPVKYVGKTLKADVSIDKETDSKVVQASAADNFPSISTETGSTSDNISRKKLQNIENLVQKLRRLNSTHDEARNDYIASLCENTNPDHRYISEILLASGLLLRELGSSLSNFQFHPSGHPINPELFLVLEQTKASTLLEEQCSAEKLTRLMIEGKFHRKLIFDTVNEILARKLVSAVPFSEPWVRPVKLGKRALNAQKLLRELCSEIELLQAKSAKCSSDEEDERWKDILRKDVMHQSESWENFEDGISGAVLDIERSIFKDLVNEIVIGESTGLKTKPGRRRLFVK